MVNTVLKKVTMIEDRGYYIQNREGKKVAFADLVANRKHFGNSFSVFAPISKIESGKVNKAFQFKAQIQINGAQIGVKIIDALDESVLGRTVLEIPIQDSAIVENSLSIKALETQVAQSLRASNKIAKSSLECKN
ncbi:MAG: hypothetical protein JNL11_09055 [Bdellovibrionaceae bacterium]|nr:hypothetical protein [Pseudobdellovibrionaceae bacterium]